MLRKSFLLSTFLFLLIPVLTFAALKVNDTPRKPGEWGFRPSPDSVIQVNPPGFCWRPQDKAEEYEVQASRTAGFEKVEYTAKDIIMTVHCPPHIFKTGNWFWRFRYKKGVEWSDWSKPRAFSIAEDAGSMPLPLKDDLLSRIPKGHPRLFVRPEQIKGLKERARSDLKPLFDKMQKKADSLLNKPPATDEPPKYPEDMKKGSEAWREIWWGNRTYTQRALGSAAELAFTWQLGGKDEYGQEARRILMECAKWDPKGSTGYRYNDEAGMPYNYYFSRTYTFVYPLLTGEERKKCRDVMKIRGDEMYRHLYPRHLWGPYASHSNRAWHFLGEIGIAFFDEIPDAGEWVWFAANVFANVYPVWNDADGGWHEGLSYWSSYIGRFTWWADIMKSAFDINAFDKPYFSQVGYYPLYVSPPGNLSGGFGDCTTGFKSSKCGSLVAVLAAQAGNPYWRWYAEQNGSKDFEDGFVGFLRSSLPVVESKPPTDLPLSRIFRGVGQAYLNTDLTDASKNIQIHFKSSPFGTQSHGYNAQNSFLLYIGGERLFLRSGKRDIYGSDHHKNWMWHTKSDNCITVNGESQGQRRADAIGQITGFESVPGLDYVVGEAGQAYQGKLDRFTRRILFIKPDAIVIWDSLQAPQESSFEWRLHTSEEMLVNGQKDVHAYNGRGGCKVEFLYPGNLNISQTDKFDPPPRPRVKLVEHHLTAVPAEKTKSQDFVTVLRPHFKDRSVEGECKIIKSASGFKLAIPVSDNGTAAVYLNSTPDKPVNINGVMKNAETAVILLDNNGKVTREWIH